MTGTLPAAFMPIDKVHAGPNARESLPDLDELTESIRYFGILEPLVCCPTEDGTGDVEVLMGQRRLAAAGRVPLAEVPIVLRPRPTEMDRLLMQLAENLERADMTPIEEAKAFRALSEHGMTRAAIAEAVSRSDFFVVTRILLLEMPECVQMALHERRVTPTTALSIPKQLFAEHHALRRLVRIGGLDDNDLRRWAHDEVRNALDRGEEVKAAYVLNRPVSLSLDWFELAQKAALDAGMKMKAWFRAAIEEKAERQGLVLPEHAKQILEGGSRSRGRR